MTCHDPDVPGVTSAVAASLSAVAASFAVLVAWATFRGQLFEMARQAHLDLTTGEVAAARDVLGKICFQTTDRIEREDLDEIRRAWFTVLWCFQRLDATRRRIERSHLITRREPLRYLDELVADQLKFLNEDYDIVRRRLAAADPGLSDGSSKAAYRRLFPAVHPELPIGGWAATDPSSMS